MRRSSAPSIKRQFPQAPDPKTSLPASKNKQCKLSECVSPDPLREFKGSEQENDPNAAIPVQNQAIIAKYAVLWNRPSTKKHKTWEGDGVIELTDGFVYLRNVDGSILSYMAISAKAVTFEEGQRITIGSKEVEIVEKLQGGVVRKVEAVEKPNPPMKLPSVSNREIFRKPTISGGLLLPEPSQEHQRINNPTRRLVNEVRVVESVAKTLRTHQKEGVIFLYECLMGFHNPEAEYHGAILADEMGLGKSLQVIATCFTLLRQGPYGHRNIARKILIVCPSSLTENWNREITKWLCEERVYAFVVDGKHKVKDFSVSGNMPFIILSYEMVASHIGVLEGMIFDVLVCDEGHRLKNSDTKVVQLLQQIDCKRRIILTGTPIQNDLHEFYCLVSFVQPDILGTYPEYRAHYENPIVSAQSPMASEAARALGEEKVSELNEITGKIILRRTQAINRAYLPAKEEIVVFCYPSEVQTFLLRSLLEIYELEEERSPLKVISLLKKICNHPALIKSLSAEETIGQKLQELLPESNELGPKDSGKLGVLEALLMELKWTQERIVIVSHSTKALDIIEGLCGHFGFTHCRLDGSTTSAERQKIVDKFNAVGSDIFIFLLSAKAGGTGLNLIGASRLVLFDSDWNPATDQQAMARIWRDGQTRNVVIYRLITAWTIEEKIFQRQISKNSLSAFVNDSSKDGISFTDADLRDLFTIITDYDDCLTHTSLNCHCQGDGSIPEPQESSQNLEMSELMQWEHHKSPLNPTLLQVSHNLLHTEQLYINPLTVCRSSA
ncbi:DNA repair and recombination protein RAD54B [Sergentomyia squamirostris]